MDDDERTYMRNIIEWLAHIADTLDDICVAVNPESSKDRPQVPPALIDKNIKCRSCGKPANQTTDEHRDFCDECYNEMASVKVDPKTLQKL